MRNRRPLPLVGIRSSWRVFSVCYLGLQWLTSNLQYPEDRSIQHPSRQLASLHGRFPRHLIPRNNIQNRSDLVPGDVFRGSRDRPRNSKHVLHAPRHLPRLTETSQCRVLHLEEHDSGVAGQYCGRWLFCCAVYWYLFLEGEEVEIHFDEMGDGRKDVCPFAENKMMTWNESCKLIFYSPSVPMTEHITNTNLRMTNGHINGHSHSKQDIHPNEPSNRPLWNSGTIAVTGFAKDYQERDCGRKIGGRVGGTTA